ELLVEMLAGAGYNVLCACDGPSAVHVAATASPKINLLITNTRLRNMTVHDMVTNLQQHNSALRILYISGHLDENLAQLLSKHVDRVFLLKPFTRDALLRKINEVLF
ncbi:MAG TPA: response regulator, partial [Candidatus Acidoferrum sp.]